MNGFCSLWCIEVVYNNKQIVGSWNEIKTDMYYSFKNFCIQLGYVMLLKYMYISSWTTSYCTCVKQSGFVNCFLIRWVPDGNADISLSLRGVYFICIDGCLSFYVHNVRQKSSALNSLKSRTGSDVRTVAIIIRVVLLSPRLCMRAVCILTEDTNTVAQFEVKTWKHRGKGSVQHFDYAAKYSIK